VAAGVDVGGTFTDIVLGGYGHLRTREKPKIVRDVIDGLLTPLKAERDYDVKSKDMRI
jgi:N-methylhydantoinase B/oxoprolinase/acetone carboxylase alpha subunit